MTIETLEQLIDSSSVQDVLSKIADICTEKAEHIRVNWQDKGLARQWEKTAESVQRLAFRVVV